MPRVAPSPPVAGCSPSARWARTSPPPASMPMTPWRRSASMARSAGATSRTGPCTADGFLPPLLAGEGWDGVPFVHAARLRRAPSRLRHPPPRLGRENTSCQRRNHHRLRFLQQAREVRLVPEALGVDLVDRLGAGGAGGEPAAFADHLDAADGGTVAGRLVQHLHDLLAGE